jgi:putative MATE family efflux protein
MSLIIQLSQRFTTRKLLKFVFPSIVMMVVSSIYGVVDGLFVSNFIGTPAFAAVNFIIPVLMIFGSPGFMIGSGGSAIVAKTMGEGDVKTARRQFSLLLYVSIALGLVLTVLGYLFMPAIAASLGESGQLLADSILYGRIYILGLAGLILLNVFQSFCITAGLPGLGLVIVAASGIANLVLDALFVMVFGWGIAGAAGASAISMLLGGILPMVYFAAPNKSPLHLTGFHMDGKVLLKTTTNGFSELMTNVSISLVNVLYNMQLMKLAGEDGLAAYGILMYVSLIFIAVFIGFSLGTAPLFSYQYGAQNYHALRDLLIKSLKIMLIASGLMFLSAEIFARPLSMLFVGYDPELLEFTVHGFHIFSFMFLFAGINIFISAFFTALHDGLVSALLSFLRCLVLQVIAVMTLPMWFGLNGIWNANTAAEAAAMALSLWFLVRMQKRYGY